MQAFGGYARHCSGTICLRGSTPKW